MKEQKGFIYLDKDTDFTGTIETSTFILEGSVTGEVHAKEEVLLKNGSSLRGDIETKKVLLEEGYSHQGDFKLCIIGMEDESINSKTSPILSEAEPDNASQNNNSGPDSSPSKSREVEQVDGRLW